MKASSNGKKNSRKKRWGIIFVIELILIAILVPVIFVYSKLSLVQSASAADVNKDNIIINDGSARNLTGYENIALFGVDSRDGSLKKDARSDSIIVLSINHDTKKIKMLSIFRDTCVKVPEYGLTKACHAYAYGGAELAMSTLNMNFDLNLTEFATVDFGVMADIIDDVDGIDIDLTQEELDVINPLIDEQNNVTGSNSEHLSEPGLQTLNGTQATAYARIRKIDSDYKRAERQRTVLTKIFEKVKSSRNRQRLEMVNDILPKVYTNLSSSDLLVLAKNLSDYTLEQSDGFPFEKAAGTLGTDGLSYVFCDGFNKNVTELHQYLFDEMNYEPSETVDEIGNEIYANGNY